MREREIEREGITCGNVRGAGTSCLAYNYNTSWVFFKVWGGGGGKVLCRQQMKPWWGDLSHERGKRMKKKGCVCTCPR